MMYVQVIAGFVLLLAGAEFLVRGAVALSRRLGISTLVIGMTVVALGTSAPELVVSMNAALTGVPAMAVGNLVGSNIANVLLILGVAALVTPVVIQPRAYVRDGAVLMGGTVLFVVLCVLGAIGLWKGLLLLGSFIGFLFYSYWRETRVGGGVAEAHLREPEEFRGLPSSVWLASVVTLLGLAGILYGADILVQGGIAVARTAGVSEEVIGLTLIAIGTSLPELAASASAAHHKQSDVALGNVIGSNLFNMLGVAGAVAVARPLPIPDQILTFDLWIMLVATLLLLPVMAIGGTLGRRTAAAFLLVYAAYIAAQAYGIPNILPA